GPSLGAVVIARYPGGVPAVSSPPTIVGVAQTAKRLAAVAGTWNGGKPPVFAYHLPRRASVGPGGIPLVGAAPPTQLGAADDSGHALTVAVTATAAGGAASAVSPATTAVTNAGGAAARPAVTASPSFTGTAVVGQSLSASVGAWSGAPTSFAFQWQRCAT